MGLKSYKESQKTEKMSQMCIFTHEAAKPTFQVKDQAGCLEILSFVFWCANVFSTIPVIRDGSDLTWKRKLLAPAQASRIILFLKHSTMASDEWDECLFIKKH